MGNFFYGTRMNTDATDFRGFFPHYFPHPLTVLQSYSLTVLQSYSLTVLQSYPLLTND
jgi:hypothetical protein